MPKPSPPKTSTAHVALQQQQQQSLNVSAVAYDDVVLMNETAETNHAFIPTCPNELNESEQHSFTQEFGEFSTQLYHQANKLHDPHNNLLISPVSVALSLALLHHAAAARTRTEIDNVLLPKHSHLQVVVIMLCSFGRAFFVFYKYV